MQNLKQCFADESEEFRTPIEPEVGGCVTLRLRVTERTNTFAWVVVGGLRIAMKVKMDNGRYQMYEAVTPPLKEITTYYYELLQGSRTVYLSRRGIVETVPVDCFFVIHPGFSIPEWSRGAVMYQIFTDRFCNGDMSNDVTEREYLYERGYAAHRTAHWDSLPLPLDVHNFYGGDLAGVRSKLDYLQYLGVEVIYFNPLFVSPSNHKYDTQDYDHIDPHFGRIVKDSGEQVPDWVGSNQMATRYIERTTDPMNLEASDKLFIELSEEIHRRGMKLILDGVFNHCGSFHKWMDREGFYKNADKDGSGAYMNPSSPYRSFFKFLPNGTYESWWGFVTLPKLNYEGSETLCREILRIAAKWVSPPYNADGWRLDVAADLGHAEEFNHRFWKRFRKTVKEANPNALILAEHYGNAGAWLDGTEWDTVMNYDAFMEPVTWFLTGMEKHSDRYSEDADCNGGLFWKNMEKALISFPGCSRECAMNQLDNHDHSRFMTRTNKTPGRLMSKGSAAASQGIRPGLYRAGVVMLMTWTGAPTLYYGDETGLCGWTDPDSRRPFPWNNENWELIEFHKYTISLRKRHKALRKGALISLAGEHGLVAYGRFLGNDRLVVAVNSGNYYRKVELSVDMVGAPQNGSMIRLLETTEDGYNVGRVPVVIRNGRISFEMRPTSSVIFMCI